jgi:hypothetical protein
MDRPHPLRRKNPITAVDIMLDPDATMIQNAQAAYSELLKNFPKATSWATNTRNMSVIGGYFHTPNLDEVFAGASKVLASEKDYRTETGLVSPEQNVIGTLVVDLNDAKNKQLVWRRIGQNTLSNNGNKNQQRVDNVV